ncbi:hypothetical protein [Streptomyces sp. NPDC058412]
MKVPASAATLRPAPGSRLQALPHWLVPPAGYAVPAALVLARFGTRLL